jgi:hypothetical protein
MKTSTMGIVSAAILMVVAGVGFGIAQADGNQSYDPMLSFGDNDINPYIDMGQAREAVETGSLPVCSYDPTLCFGDNDVNPYIDVGQAREAVGTGNLPAVSIEDSSIAGTEEDQYRGWGIKAE